MDSLSPGGGISFAAASIKYGTVIGHVGNVISVRIDGISEELFNSKITAVAVNPTNGKPIIPPVGAFGVLLVQNDSGIWLGTAPNPSKDQSSDKPSSGDTLSLSAPNDPEGNTGLKVSKNGFGLISKEVSVIANKGVMKTSVGSSTACLGKDSYQLKTGNSDLFLNDTLGKFYTKGALQLVGERGLYLASGESVFITSGIYNSKEDNVLQRYGPVNKFIVNANETKISTGGMFGIDAGTLHINLSSGVLAGSPQPGDGSLTVCNLNIVQGNLLVSSSLGNMDFAVLGLPNYFKVKTGSFASPIFSELKLTRMALSLGNFTAGLLSTIELTKGTVDIFAIKTVSVSAGANVAMEALANFTIEAKAKLSLNALAQMTLESKALMEIKAQILNLENAKIIMMGNKIAAPTGKGPFCAIPACVITGTQHTGDVALG